MARAGGLLGALLLVAAGVAFAPDQAEEIPFVRNVIAPSGPPCPCGKALADINGDGRLDAIVAGSEGPLVWYAGPEWTASTIAGEGSEGSATEGGLAAADLDLDGDLDVTVGTAWFENPRLPAGDPAAGAWPGH